MITDIYLYVQITRGTSIGPCLTLSGQSYSIASVNAWRYLNCKGLLLFNSTLTTTTSAGV